MKTLSSFALFSLLLSSVIYFFSYPEVDPDLWGHLFFGKEILQRVRVPAVNLYSYTAPDYPWINHEWLAEVIFYEIFSLFGSPGLIVLKVIIGAMIVWILDLIIKKRAASPFARVLTLVWSMAILCPGFNVRPQLFTYLFFAIFVFLFYRYDEGKKRILYWAPLLMILWVNLHGGFVAGLGALGLFSLWTVVRGNRGLIMPVALALVSVLLNPYGFRLLSFLTEDLLLHRPITEWQPIALGDASFWQFKLALLALLVCSAWRGFWQRWDFVLALLAGWFALRHQRHMPLFAIVAAPLLAEGIHEVISWMEGKVRGWVLAFAILPISLAQFASIGRVHWEHGFRLVVSPLEYPTQAADFLKRNAVRGNLVVPFDWGEYFIWKFYPGIRVSIDGRYTTAYPREVIEAHWEWMEAGEGWRRLLERYPAEIAITNRHHPVTSLLRKDPEWVYIYSDPGSFIFVRKTASQEELLTKFKEKRLLPPQPPPFYFPG